MIRIREAIIVEGRYDKNTLAQIVDAPILETSGFGIFHDSQRLALLRRLAETRGIIVLTDSDGAGFVIRNYLRGAIDPAQVKHAYIPDVAGKERRKRTASKEGKLGVEGMRPEVLLCANNHLALHCLQYIRRRGLKIPQDVALLTFDNYPFSMLMDPTVTAVEVDMYDMGVNAARFVLQRIRKPNLRTQSYVTSPCILEREST